MHWPLQNSHSYFSDQLYNLRGKLAPNMAVLFVSVLLVFLQTFATAQDFSATCGALSEPTTCSEGAPGDFDEACRTGFINAPLHTFPAEQRILLDTYDYADLFSNFRDILWTSRSFDGDNIEVL